MTPYLIAMIVVVVLAIAVLGIVLVGIEGRGKTRAPKLANKVARAAQHLNGDGQPPKAFTRIFS